MWSRPRLPAPVLLTIVLAAGACGRETAAAPNPTVARGAALYGQYCATCHGLAGYGYVADNAPSLRTATFLATATDNFLEAAILRGRPGTAMGAYGRATGGPLGPEDAAAIVAFLRDGGPPRVIPPASALPSDATRGKAVYEQYCRRCHGTQTQRVSAIHLANPVLLETSSEPFLRYAVEMGRPPTSMAAWKEALTPQQIGDVVAYVRSMAPPPGTAPVAAAPPPTPPQAPPFPPAVPRKGPVVINAKGRAPDFQLREGRFVSIDQVKKALDQKRRLVIADARGPAEWTSLHIPGAISTPYYDAKTLDDIPNDGTWVVAYCGCPHHLSGNVVDALRQRGYKNTAILDEGIFAWQTKGYPVITPPGAKPAPAPPPPAPAPPPPRR